MRKMYQTIQVQGSTR